MPLNRTTESFGGKLHSFVVSRVQKERPNESGRERPRAATFGRNFLRPDRLHEPRKLGALLDRYLADRFIEMSLARGWSPHQSRIPKLENEFKQLERERVCVLLIRFIHFERHPFRSPPSDRRAIESYTLSLAYHVFLQRSSDSPHILTSLLRPTSPSQIRLFI